mgnify:CR=1 FL=1
MQLSVTGHHVEITPALRSYLEKKCERLVRHFDQLIDAHWVLTVEKLRQKAEATLHVRGETIHGAIQFAEGHGVAVADHGRAVRLRSGVSRQRRRDGLVFRHARLAIAAG